MAIQAKLPQIEADKWKTAIDNLTKLRVAEINAGIDKAQTDEDMLEHLSGLAHDATMQRMQHEHEKSQARQQAAAQSQQSAQDAQQQQEAVENQPAEATQ